MALYIRFMISLAFGLIGLGIVLKIVIDEMFCDWDALSEAKAWVRGVFFEKHRGHVRAEDMLLEIEKAKTTQASFRLIDQRREALREIASVERRMKGPATSSPIKLTPLAPMPVSSPTNQ
jgi:hypothetical protein